jgi:predicted nucleic acid-binding Zn ribbon protein
MVITTRFKEEPLVQCTEPECRLKPQLTRQRVRQHVDRTGHAVKVIVEDVTIYRKGS